ncbi:MAG: hypothetical protein GC208_10425 [Alphaproteobacteria bacterium]|nr:hypothetical protein [Alphaproteobacteria bacterium]
MKAEELAVEGMSRVIENATQPHASALRSMEEQIQQAIYERRWEDLKHLTAEMDELLAAVPTVLPQPFHAAPLQRTSG